MRLKYVRRAYHSLTKNIKRRVVLWVIYGLPILYVLHISKVVGVFLLMGFILMDEYLKEGYWIKLSDIDITHENILVALLITLVILLL